MKPELDYADIFLIYEFGYDCVMYFYYDAIDNIFYNEWGEIVWNIFDKITPNDLLLFKKDNWHCSFQHRDNPRILCTILLK